MFEIKPSFTHSFILNTYCAIRMQLHRATNESSNICFVLTCLWAGGHWARCVPPAPAAGEGRLLLLQLFLLLRPRPAVTDWGCGTGVWQEETRGWSQCFPAHSWKKNRGWSHDSVAWPGSEPGRKTSARRTRRMKRWMTGWRASPSAMMGEIEYQNHDSSKKVSFQLDVRSDPSLSNTI